ncbi:MAG TPA: nucleotide sugar dehydrogenase [Longimicrobiales bacterium]
MNYSVVGLGKLGCSMAAAIASRGHEVVGHDVAAEIVDRINAGLAPVAETGLQDLITAHRERLRATHSLEEAIHDSDVTFVVVPTPSDDAGAFDLTFAARAFAAIGAALASKWEPHTIVLTSTVLPGSTRYGLIPVLEEAAGRAVGDGIGVGYSPAFIALGSVIRDFLHPDFLLIGESDETAGDTLERAYREIMPQAPPVRRMSLENAELTKIAVNTFVTMKISFANMIASLCERIPGGDVDVVTAALGADRRIGRAYLTGALGYGGPCFPRDNRALSYIARHLESTAPLAEATDTVNRALPPRVLGRLAPRLATARAVGVLGLAYKPDTPVLEASQSVDIARAVAATGVRVLAHDPLAGPEAAALLGGGVQLLEDVHDVVSQADIVLITTADPAYRALRADDFRRNGSRVLVFDFWRVLRQDLAECEDIEYIAVGLTDDDTDRSDRLRALWTAPAESDPSQHR